MMVINRIKKKIPKVKPVVPKPKITLDRLGQIYFTFKEVTKLALKIRPKLLIAIFILNAIWGFSALPGFYLEKLILDRLVAAIGNPDWRPVLYSVAVFITLDLLLQLGRTFLGGYNHFLRRTLSRFFDTELHILVGKKLSELDLAMIEDPDFRDRFDKIEKESSRRAWGLMMPISNIPNYLVGFITTVGVLVFIHPLVAAVVVLVSLPQIFIDSKFIKKDYKLVTELSPLRRIWSWLNHYLIRNRNYMEMKLLELSGPLSARLRKVAYEVLERRVELGRKREIYRIFSYIPLTIFELGLSVYLVYWVIIKTITIGTFQLYLRSLRSAQQNLTGLVSSLLEVYENYVYVTDLVWFLNLEPEIEKERKGVIFEKGKELRIEINNVWFRYRTDQPWVIRDINLIIEPGEKIAIVGENGVGKSTLIKLICRFYDSQKGQILVDNHDLKNINLKSWRKKLGVLFQKFETYPFSAHDSIGYGDVGRIKNLSEIKEAAKKTGIDEYIESLPLGWENPLAPEFEKGVNPSIGQWQRIGISRMMFRKNAEILILDEPTSNVDPKAEEKIFNELLKIAKNKILIFVSQRFSTVRRADRIFVMDKGRVIEQGSHDELMKKNGNYAELFNLQAEGYK